MGSSPIVTADRGARGARIDESSKKLTHPLILLACGAAIFLGAIFAPPSLMDDVDAVNAQIARNMLTSGDWVTARIDGVAYLEKSPLGYWLMAISYWIFGVHDWAARIPTALGAMALMWVTAALGSWGFGRRAGFYAGLAVGSSAGLFLFTRIVIPDVLLTLAVTTSIYCFLRALDVPPAGETPPARPSLWALGFWGAIGAGMLLKGLLGALVPAASGGLYLLFRRELFRARTWRLLRPFPGITIALGIYAPWVVLATLRNPPFFDFTLHSDPGVYRGFFWFYFINEHVLRFLNLRYPRDYNTVPRLPFLLLHLVWLFPWSAFLPAAVLGQDPDPAGSGRARRLKLMAAIWIVFLLTFLSFSTTQEYYSMPCYPAFAVLLGAAVAAPPSRWKSAAYGFLAVVGCLVAGAAGAILYLTRGVEPAGDISAALTQNPEAYTLSLGHMADLTLRSFAYLRAPLALAGAAMGAGAGAAWLTRRGPLAPLCLAGMMTVSLYAAHMAMGVFDPYLSSRPLAEAIARAPEGQLVIEGHYYPASSVVFYTNRAALLHNGRQDNLVYGSAAPDVPQVFVDDGELARLWKGNQRLYLVAPQSRQPEYERMLGKVRVLAASGGKCVFTNR
jgi:4-amino-4-deoxy-L-arabinose transferase-like glycosyltransferase